MQKRKTCGKKGKWWYWLQEFRPRGGGSYVVGKFGSYKTSTAEKVEIDWKPLGVAERERLAAEQREASRLRDVARAQESEIAAMSAGELWRRAERTGVSAYLKRKDVEPEACRYLPDGSIVIPLIRYDLPRAEALRATQRIKPDGQKFYTKGFAKPGCALRLGMPEECSDQLILTCEGYATGLSLRMATARNYMVYVALDAGNLAHVVPLVHGLHPEARQLICADDDWLTTDHEGTKNNPGRTVARKVAKEVPRCDFVWPVFNPATRNDKDTDFNDLHLRQGLDVVASQVGSVIKLMEMRR